MNALEERLGYRFGDPQLLRQALTHPSAVAESAELEWDNQRLEFLGDAVLQLILTERLFRDFRDFPEGVLTPMRSRLVSGAALARMARRLRLGEALLLGKGEESCGGRDRDGLLADAFEAVLGAMYLDGDLEVVRRFVEKIFAAALREVAESPDEISPKGRLQILLQSDGAEGPVYQVVGETGPDHERVFDVEVRWRGRLLGRGSGRSKKAAEKAAARAALEAHLWENDDFA